MKRKIKAFIFNLIRPIIVSNLDHREDFTCVVCSEPVLQRILTCSEKCSIIFNKFP